MASTVIEMIVKQITDMTTKEIAAWGTTGALQEAAADEVTEALRLIKRIEDELNHQIATARDDLDRAVGDLAAGYHINEAGILQSTALKIEMLAPRRKDAYDRLQSACRMVAAIAAA